MSWKSQKDYTLGFIPVYSVPANPAVAETVLTTLLTSGPVPAGTYVIVVNGCLAVGDFDIVNILLYADGQVAPLSQTGFTTVQSATFAPLVSGFKSDGTSEFTVEILGTLATGATFTTSAFTVQLIKLIN